MTRRSRRIGLGIGAVAVIALGLAAGVYVSAQNTDGPRGPFCRGRRGPGGPGGLRGPGGPMGALGPLVRCCGRLDLTDAQRDQVKSVMDSHRDEMKALGDRAMAAHQRSTAR